MVETLTAPDQTYTANTVESAPVVNTQLQTQDQAAVKLWCSRIKASKKKFAPDFKRMREDMEFVYGLQWDGQKDLNTDKYIAYITLRMIQQKVATLYAKNPTSVATRRKRLDFQVWDGSMESLTGAIMQAQQMVMSGVPLPLEIAALFADYQHGKQQQKLIEKFCETFEIVYGYQIDASKPEYKEQIKQAVRRGVITCVAYARPIFCRDGDTYQQPLTIDAKSGVEDRLDRVRGLLAKMDAKEVDEESADYQTLRSLMASLGASNQLQNESTLSERIEFDFPPSTSIIVDERCRNLVDFVAARWIAQEYVLPLDEVNEIFGVKIEVGTGEGSAKEYGMADGEEVRNGVESNHEKDPLCRKMVCLYEVFDYRTKTRCFIVDGWKDFVLPPEPVKPNITGFWNHFALVFNNVEVEPGSDASIYPPSDVRTIRAAQKEWNRTREDLRDHRRANSPRYLAREGTVSPEDAQKIADASPNSVTFLKSVPPDMKLQDVFVAMPVVPIAEGLYETGPLEQDLMLGANMQQANVGPAQPNVTATVGSIAEQSRMNVSSSNVDDLDGWLNRIAAASGEMMLQEMSVETVKRIAGVGAVWPDSIESRQDFSNEVFMSIQSSSSGRPNQAIDIQNLVQIMPLLQAAGANPVAMVEKTVKVLDPNLDVDEFFPLTSQMPQAQAGEQGSGEGEKSPSKEPAPPNQPPDQGLETTAPLAG